MGSFFALTILYLSIAGVKSLSHNATFIAQEISEISACGLACLEQTIPSVGCSLLNTTCQCSSSDLVSITSDCMKSNCTLTESLELDKIQAAICERPYESRSGEIKVVIIVGATITYTAVLLRFISRYFLAHKIGLDDWFILAAVCSDIVFTSFSVKVHQHGFGEHIWTIDINTVEQLLYWFYICEIFYVINIALIKISILFFYLHLFPKRSFRVQCWIAMAFCAATCIAFTFTTVFQCHPISYTWNRNLKGKCVNHNSASWVNAAINILQDILIMLLPASELRMLQLSLRRKIGLYVMFGLGGLVCILSIIRLWSLRTFGLTADPTWDNVPTTFWSILETTVAILCACVPAIRAGFAQAFSRAWESSVNHSTIFSQKISVGRVGNSMAAGPSGQSWPAQELGSKSTLDILDEEADPPGTSKLSLSCLPDPRRELAFDSGLNLMKPLPLPVSRPTYISSLKK